METNKFFDAVIVTLGDKELTKSNGNLYKLHKVQFTSGDLKDGTYLCQYTLGDNKPELSVGDKVRAYMSIVTREITDPETGEVSVAKRPFFELSTSDCMRPEEVLAKLGLE